ncbi:MAG: hypothetical protein NTV06_07865, partial [candidate division Zixibacteria bacterium]|nr:hypothetical protein [candidate division Zixibacteria bacterium]
FSLSGLSELNLLDINSISKSALVTAGLHFLSGSMSKYPWEILKLQGPAPIVTSYTVSIDETGKMLEEIGKAEYPIIKIKMGFEDDEALIPELKKVSGKSLRVDANGGWTLEKAERMIHLLAQIGVTIIEQPTDVDYVGEWKYLKGKEKVELIIDEGLNNSNDYYRLADYVDGINIKMAKAGGIIEAKKIAQAARRNKLKVMLGCMLESSIGIAPAVYLSSLADYFDLDGPLLLEEDTAVGINYNVEKIVVNDDIIGGPKLKREFLKDANI